MQYSPRQWKIYVPMFALLLLSACGPGSINIAPPTDKWTSKTTNHGLGNLEDQILLPMANGDLYLVGSKLESVTGGYAHQPILAKSTDGGATWSRAGIPAPPADVLYGFAATSTGTKIVLMGGAIGYGNTNVAPAYNPNIMVFNTATNAWVSYNGSPIGGSFIQKMGHAMAHDGNGNIYVSGGSTLSPGTSALDAYPSYRLWKSADAGVNWSEVSSGIVEGATRGYEAIHNHCMIANGNTLYLLGGETAPIHTDLPTPGNPGGNFVTPAEITYSTKIRRSVDGGVSWAVVNSSAPEAAKYTACAQVGGTLYSSGGLNKTNQVASTVRQSTDGGITWTAQPSSALHGFRYGHSMAVRNGKLLIFSGLTAGTPNHKTDVIEATP